MSWFPGINGRPGIVTADWLMTRGNTISNGSEYVTKIQAAKNILLTPTADAKASELVADIARLGQALRGGVAVAPTLHANPPAGAEADAAEADAAAADAEAAAASSGVAASPLARSYSSGSEFIPYEDPAVARARVAAAEAAAVAADAEAPAAAPGAEESRGALNSSVFGGRRHQTPKRRRSGRNGLSKKRRHTGK